MALPLANKYRPKTFEDVSEQGAIKVIIENQINKNDLRNAYLFCGGAGTGKTTCARIVADMINNGKGIPIELDAASNNSVDDVRKIIADSKFKSISGEYKIYIIDECHSLSNQAWQAMLKLLEEPPASTIFIFCTTDPQKIPSTILSRVQRFNFQRISKDGIMKRLEYIIKKENEDIVMDNGGSQDDLHDDQWAIKSGIPIIEYELEALDYIAKQAEGGMRDAITTLDKCLSFSNNISLQNVVKVLFSGVSPYELSLFNKMIYNKETQNALNKLNEFYMTGIPMQLFLEMYFEFLLNLQKYLILGYESSANLPNDLLQENKNLDSNIIREFIQKLFNVINVNKINAKNLIEAWVIERCL